MGEYRPWPSPWQFNKRTPKMMHLLLKNPMIVGRSDDLLLLVQKEDLDNPNALAQVWSSTIGYSSLWPLAVLCAQIRFTAIDPPIPLSEELIGG